MIVLCLPTGAARNQQPPVFPNINYLGTGYNIFRGNPHSTEGLDPGFMGQALYDLSSYDEGRKTSDGLYTVPDHVNALESLACSFAFSSCGIKEVASYFQSLKVDVDASYSGFGASFSGSANYNEVEKNMASRETQYVSSYAYCEVYLAALEPGAVISEGFKLAVQSLPSENPNLEYLDFIRAYGTHYIASVRMGGRYGFQSKFETNKYMSMLSNGLDVSAAAGYSAAQEINAAIATKTQMDQIKEFNSARQSYSIYQVGGQPPKGTAMDWAHTVKDDPLPVRYRLVEIANLFTADNFNDTKINDKQILLKNAIMQYCNSLLLPLCNSSVPESTPHIRIITSKEVSQKGFMKKAGTNVFFQTVNNPYLAVMGMFLRVYGDDPPKSSYALVDSRYAPLDLIKPALNWMNIGSDVGFYRPNCSANFTRLSDFQCPTGSGSAPDCLGFLPKILPCVANHCLTQCSSTKIEASKYNEYIINNGFKMFGNGNADTSGDLNFITISKDGSRPPNNLFMCLTSDCVMDFN